MAAEIDKDKCTGCGTCVEQCHVGALRVKDGMAKVDPESCAECGLCIDVCPAGALSLS